MRQSAPLAQETTGFEISTVGFLAHSLGVLTGGLLVDREIDLGNTDITLMIMQAIYQDAGDKRMVTGSSNAMSGGYLITLNDGEIHKFSLRTDGANLIATGEKATEEDMKDSEAYLSANAILSQLATSLLDSKGLFDGDDYTARTITDAAGAIQNKIQGRVITVLRKAGMPTKGYVVEVDGLTNGTEWRAAMDSAKLREMTKEEIDEERKLFMDTIGTQNIFNTPVGQA